MKWISVKEKVPDFNVPILAFDNQRIYLCLREKREDYNEHWTVCQEQDCKCAGCTGAITHWMPLPKAPNK